MNYVEHFSRFGIDAKQIPCVKGSGAPTVETDGAVGLLYMDTLTGDVYKCTAVSDGRYTWEPFEKVITFTDAKYFDIDYDGVLSLKPEYRGCPGSSADFNTAEVVAQYPYAVSDNGVGVEGSKIDELPEEIVIPEIIGNTVVTGFQKGMFYFNWRVKKIVLPDSVKVIPEFFCHDTRHMRSIENTEHITNIGAKGFKNCGINRALFPKLKEMGEGAFTQCKLLTVVDIGGITEIPPEAFRGCSNLSCVLGGENVTTVGKNSFPMCYRLKNLPFLSHVTSIGASAFIASRVQFDWGTLTNCTFDKNYSTPVIDNTTDYWSACTYTPCENPLNSVFDQRDPRWANETFGTSGHPYSKGCAIITLLHIHSALSGKKYDSPVQFEEELAQLGTVDMSVAKRGATAIETVAKALGYKTTLVGSVITAENYQMLCDKLAAGAYAYVGIGQLTNPNSGHAVCLYGINGIGEVKVVDSDFVYMLVDEYKAETYEIPFQNFTGPDSDFIIIEKA